MAFSVSPSTTPRGYLGSRRCRRCPAPPTHRWSAKCTPSIISATRSISDRSAASIVARADSVAPRSGGSPPTSTSTGRWPRPGRRPARVPPSTAGRQLGHHPLQGHATRAARWRRQLIGRHRPPRRFRRRCAPGAGAPAPSAAQGDRARLAAVAHGGAIRIVLELRPRQRGDVLVHQRLHDLQAGTDGERHSPPGANRRARPGTRRPIPTSSPSGRGRGGVVLLVVLLHGGGPLLVGVLGGTPDTYHQAGFERGTATSTSTTTGTTSFRHSVPARPVSEEGSEDEQHVFCSRAPTCDQPRHAVVLKAGLSPRRPRSPLPLRGTMASESEPFLRTSRRVNPSRGGLRPSLRACSEAS